jgi:hypothetical protein
MANSSELYSARAETGLTGRRQMTASGLFLNEKERTKEPLAVGLSSFRCRRAVGSNGVETNKDPLSYSIFASGIYRATNSGTAFLKKAASLHSPVQSRSENALGVALARRTLNWYIEHCTDCRPLSIRVSILRRGR